MKKILRRLLLITCACGINPQLGVANDEPRTKPSVLFVLADDMGYGDLKAFNPDSRIETPHLDKLARAGMCFTNAHSGGSTCRPSRYALLTGRFAARKDSSSNRVPVIREGRDTVASMLRENGYRTAMVGKWHLGFDRRATKNERSGKGLDFDYAHALTRGPVDRGFDSFFGMHASLDPRSPLLHGGKVVRDGDWKLINPKGSRGFGANRKTKYGIELYNLKDDLSEQSNLAAEMPEKVESLRQATLCRILEDSTTRSSSKDSTWRELFNGKDLSGWDANARPESFTVQNGLLKAHGKNGMAHLFYVGDTGRDVAFKNFELVSVVRSERNSNSGIFFHTSRELRKRKYLNKGYEVQLNSSEKEKRKTGSLYGIVNLDTSPVDETRWFEMRLRVEGKRIQVFIEGKRVVDYTEPDHPVREPSRRKRLLDLNGGAIAIQAHDPNSVFYFKQIRIRELK